MLCVCPLYSNVMNKMRYLSDDKIFLSRDDTLTILISEFFFSCFFFFFFFFFFLFCFFTLLFTKMEASLPPSISLDSVVRWSAHGSVALPVAIETSIDRPSPFVVDRELNDKICIWNGDQLALEVDAVVNATSEQFNDRSAFTRRLSALAGDELSVAVARLDGCRTGEAKITPGFNLRARYIVHTVGPRYNARYRTAAENALHSCYRGCVQLMKETRLRTIAFCVINSEKRGFGFFFFFFFFFFFLIFFCKAIQRKKELILLFAHFADAWSITDQIWIVLCFVLTMRLIWLCIHRS